MRLGRKHGTKAYYSREWYLRRWEHGRAVYFSLGRDLKGAQALATQIDGLIRSGTKTLQEVKEHFCRRQSQRRTPASQSTLGDVARVLREEYGLLNLSRQSAESYACSLLKIVREVISARTGKMQDAAAVASTPCSILTAATLNDFKRLRFEAAEKLGDELKKASALRSANKDLRQAKAVFSESTVRICSEAGIPLPDLDGWRSVTQFTGLEDKYRLPPSALVQAVMSRIHALTPGSNLWLATFLAAHVGLRRHEIIAARWSWFIPGPIPRIHVRRESDFVPKKAHERKIEVEPWVFTLLSSFNTHGQTYLLPGEKDERRNVVDTHSIHFLRSHGVTVQKPAHELRKWFGSWTAATRGLTIAQRQLGHESYATTESHYGDIHFPEELRTIWEKPGC